MTTSRETAIGGASGLRPSGLRRAVQRTHGALSTYLGVGGVLMVAFLVLAATQPAFATVGNLIGILETNASLLIVAVGLTFVLLVGGFDLSVGGMLAIAGVVLGLLVGSGLNAYASIALVLVGACVVGFLTNGLLIGRVGLSFFVVTLGTMSIFRGTALLLTDGESIGLYDQPQITWLGSGEVLGLPVSVWIALTVFTVALMVTRYTGYGRMLYAAGGNPEAARLAGIDTRTVRASAYVICAGLAAVAGVVMSGRLASASPTSGMGIELAAAAAVLLGGTSFAGGQGGMFGTLLGALFLGVLANGLTISQVSSFWQGVVSGVVLIIAVTLDWLRSRRERRGRW